MRRETHALILTLLSVFWVVVQLSTSLLPIPTLWCGHTVTRHGRAFTWPEVTHLSYRLDLLSSSLFIVTLLEPLDILHKHDNVFHQHFMACILPHSIAIMFIDNDLHGVICILRKILCLFLHQHLYLLHIQYHLNNAQNIFLLYSNFKINIVNNFITEKVKKKKIVREFISGLTQEPIFMQLKENKTANVIPTHLLWKPSPLSAFPVWQVTAKKTNLWWQTSPRLRRSMHNS